MRYLAALAVAAALALPASASARSSSASSYVEHGAAVLVWLDTHPRPGTPRSRAAVARDHRYLVWVGLRRLGLAWRDRRRGDVDPRSPFGCIHGGEGSWRDGGAPFWGGLQMDLGYQASYGRDFLRAYGLADRWPIWAQLVAGYRGWRGRGFSPWPNTARACGLL